MSRATSAVSSRNFLVDMSASRMRPSLCRTSGWVTWMTGMARMEWMSVEGRRAAPSAPALAHCLVQAHAAGNRDVQALHGAGHRDADELVAVTTRELPHAAALGAEHEG